MTMLVASVASTPATSFALMAAARLAITDRMAASSTA
jgi:hypothetical protein